MPVAFFDVDTQLDFVAPAGALYVPGAEAIVGAVAQLNQHASRHRIPLISTVDAHTEDDPEFAVWPPHCIAGTLGQQKPAGTLVSGQILFEKQVNDCFFSGELVSVLAGLPASEYVVYGVVTEICVRYAVEGLLKAGKRVHLVTDAIRELNSLEAAKVLDLTRQSAGRILTQQEARQLS
jgi:nicotinamidase/pyrazinamidase